MKVERFSLYVIIFSCLLTVSNPLVAQGFTGNAAEYALSVKAQDSHYNKVEWDETAVQSQEKLNRALIRIKRLEEENAQITEAMHRKYQSRIRELLQENKRLSLERARAPDNTYDIQALSKQLSALESENEALRRDILAAKSKQSNDGAVSKLQTQISVLEKRNAALAASLAASSTKPASENTDVLTEQVQTLQNQIEVLRQENRNIAQSLAEATTKAFSLDNKEDEFTKKSKLSMQRIVKLEDSLDNLRIENESLKTQLQEKGEFEGNVEENTELNAELNSLRKQNEMLTQKLEQAGPATSSDEDLLREIKKLKEGIAKRDDFISRMEILRAAAEALKAENERLTEELAHSKSNVSSLDAPQKNRQTKSLVIHEGQNSSNNEKAEYEDIMVAYRKKIHEYQQEIGQLKGLLQQASANDDVAATTGSDESIKKEHKISALQLENQELRARIKLLSDRQSSLVFQTADGQRAKASMAPIKEEGDPLKGTQYDPEKINIMSVKANVQQPAKTVSTSLSVEGEGDDGSVINYTMPRESLEMLRERGVLK